VIPLAWAPALISLLLSQAPRRPPTFASTAEVVRLDVLALERERAAAQHDEYDALRRKIEGDAQD